MPEYPHKARLLTPVEKSYAVWRLEIEAGAGEANEEQSTFNSFRQAFLDPKIWALVWCMGMSQAMGSTNNFFPSIVQTLGYNSMITMLLTAPPALLAALIAYIVSYYSDVSAKSHQGLICAKCWKVNANVSPQSSAGTKSSPFFAVPLRQQSSRTLFLLRRLTLPLATLP